MLNIALLWHMHQPYYVSPRTRTALMPWVRLHAVKGYLDMITMAQRNPEARMIFNLTPVLIKQIEELNNGEVMDLWEQWTQIPAAELTLIQKRLLLENFFKANWDHLIRPYRRYHELLVKRGYDLGHISLDTIAPSFSKQDYLDLQVWFNLAWCGYAACSEYPELKELKAKERSFSEQDKALVLSVHHRILKSILSRYRALMKINQIEISTTPFFHPISPLIFDSNFAHRCMPWASLPPHFHWPEDIETQTRLAVEQYQRIFDRSPSGLWPSEGSVCPELIPIWEKLGFRWFATDEEILFQSLGQQSTQEVKRADLYDAYEAVWEGSRLCAVFRDRAISDFIGFSAARNSPLDAAAFIMHRIQEILTIVDLKTEPLLAIVLDGENAWEFFPDGGEHFLTELFNALTRSRDWKLTTLHDYTTSSISRRSLTRLQTGSWIQANFDIWIGDSEENLAWQLLGETRAWLESQRGKLAPEIEEQSRLEIYAAEGSDWFWWYGPDFQTDNDLLFDELFRTHLQNVYFLCNSVPPDRLSYPICRPSTQSSMAIPIDLIEPKLDGIQSNYFEWHEAGHYEVSTSYGTMFQSERIVRKLFYGFDLKNFYLRIDGFPDLQSQTGLRLRIHFEGRDSLDYDWSPATGSIVTANDPATRFSQVAYRKIVEIGVSFSGSCYQVGDLVRFHLSVARRINKNQLLELERHPAKTELEFRVPDPIFVATRWSA